MSLRKNQIGEWCNGNTADSDSVFWGSNPYSPAKEKQTTFVVCFSFLWQRNRRAEPQLAQRAGFAFERQPSGSLLTSGKAKNLRALHEYPYSRPHLWSVFLSFDSGIGAPNLSAEALCQGAGYCRSGKNLIKLHMSH